MKEHRMAAVFPGQGSQRPGMGKDFYDKIIVSRETYEEASDALGWDVGALCFSEDPKLNLTEYTQPCILTTEIAMFRGMQSLFGYDPEIFGGHSLGEFTALVASGALPFADALKIVHVRGRLMQNAVPVGVGGMSAVISDHLDAGAIQNALSDLQIDVANINSARQIVISGSASSMPDAASRVTEIMKGAEHFRFVPLNVSAPFHSRFMRRIEKPFEDALLEMAMALDVHRTSYVTSNYTGGFHSGIKEEVIRNLVSQLSHPVQWTSNMAMLAERSESIYEIGPGRPLRDFFKTLDVACSSVTTLTAAMRLLAGSN